jgi:hypothetical protein
MAGIPEPAYRQFCMDKRSSLKSEYETIIDTYSDAINATII